MIPKKILVVEDDGDVRLGYHVLLRAHHYQTCFAADSVSAISEARRERPDLILLDLGLPGGDGFVVLERLRMNTNLSMIPVVVVSARDHHGNESRALEAGARAYVQKPWDDDVLLSLIRRELDQPAAPAARVA